MAVGHLFFTEFLPFCCGPCTKCVHPNMAERGEVNRAGLAELDYEPLPRDEVERRTNEVGGDDWLRRQTEINRYYETGWKPSDQKRRIEESCARRIVQYELGKSAFSDHLVSFKAAIEPEEHRLNNSAVHRLLYFSCGKEARKLLGDANVPARHALKGVQEYYDLVQEVFEPASESEGIRLEFLNRTQGASEQPQRYYKNKRNLFMRAYKPAFRDYRFFFGEIIRGLINPEMRTKLRYEVPAKCGPEDETAFFEKVMHVANVLRTRRMAGEISEAECIGAEATYQNYSAQDPPPDRSNDTGNYQFKQEPVFAVASKNNPVSRNCYYCLTQGHFIAQCPRKAGGFPAAVHAVGCADGPPQAYARQPVHSQSNGYCSAEGHVYAIPEGQESFPEDPEASVNALPYRGGYQRGGYQRGRARGSVSRGVYRPGSQNGYSMRTMTPGPRFPPAGGSAAPGGIPRTPYKKFHNNAESFRTPPGVRVAYLQQDKDGNEYWQECHGDTTPPAAHVAPVTHVGTQQEAHQEEEGVHALPSSDESDYTYMMPQPFLGL